MASPGGAAAALAACICLWAPGAAGAAPRVAVSIKPLHALVAGVMDGIGTPELVVRAAGSPHTYSLKPSEARLLERAEVIFWVGGTLEGFLERPLAALAAKAKVVAVLRAPGVVALPARAGGAWDDREEHDGHGEAAHGADAAAPYGSASAAR